MQTRTPSLRAVDLLALALLALLLLRFGVRAAGPIDDPDTWWHLRLGEEFRGNWSLSDPGQLSAFGDQPWFATQWTLELLASFLYESFGLPAVSWLTGLGVLALGVAVYASCRERAGVPAAALATGVALLGSAMSHSPRPQIASFICVALVTAAWLRSAEDGKPRWWLVALAWLWAGTHGMWFIGIAIGVVAVLGIALDRQLDKSTCLKLAAVPVVSLLATALTPVGPKLLLAPLATSKMTKFITEWDPPDFSDLVPAVAIVAVGVTAVTWARSSSQQRWVDLLLLATALGWVLLYNRTIAVGVVVAAPLLAGAVQTWLPRGLLDRVRGERSFVGLAAIVAAASLALVVSNNPLGSDYQPRGLDDRLASLPRGTVVLNSYEIGGWLEWRHRNVVPVVDGMTDAYSVDHIERYMRASRLERDWYAFVEEVGAQHAVLEVDAPLAVALEEQEDWRVLDRAGGYAYLTAPNLRS